MQLMKKTSLEISSDIVDTLNWKLSELNKGSLPAENAIADYITLAVDNLSQEADYIKSVQRDFETQRKIKLKQIEDIKVQGAEFFQSIGLVKLEGIKCSSITLTKAKESQTSTTEKIIFHPWISPAEIEELLIGLGKAEMKTVTETNSSIAKPSKLRINKRNENNTSAA